MWLEPWHKKRNFLEMIGPDNRKDEIGMLCARCVKTVLRFADHPLGHSDISLRSFARFLAQLRRSNMNDGACMQFSCAKLSVGAVVVEKVVDPALS